jgi:hypothetical protein
VLREPAANRRREQELHEARVLNVRSFEAGRVHMSNAYELVLDSGHICIFKPADSLLAAAEDGLYHGKQALEKYDHTPVSTTIAECAAWQLAKAPGWLWSTSSGSGPSTAMPLASPATRAATSGSHGWPSFCPS